MEKFHLNSKLFASFCQALFQPFPPLFAQIGPTAGKLVQRALGRQLRIAATQFNPYLQPMLYPPDYHMHTPLCRHATGEPVDYAARAVQLGLQEIGFSDHSPMSRDDFDDWRMRLDQLDLYVQKVRQAQSQFPNLTIKLGLEVDYLPGHEDWIRTLAHRHPWDYFIGSVHYISETWDFDNPTKISEWKKRHPFEVWSLYYERLLLSVESGLFDIIGHADLCKKFCFYPEQDCTGLYARFLDAVKNRDVSIEINTSGLRKSCREMYPGIQILQMASDRAIPLSFGSDAHAPEEVGLNFSEALALARTVGYTECCQFTGRKRVMIPLEG
jgi:histidinol-phosphatase (PHP family)